MIKFFRTTRQNLLNQGKSSRYLKYAIGEIVLVVIGILIALSINNWNEQRKDDFAENKALVALKDEFEKNIERLQNICEQRDSSQASHRAYWDIINNDTIPPVTKAKEYPKGSFGGTWAAQNTVLNGLVNSGQIDNIKNDTLKRLLTLWPNRVQFWKDDEVKWRELIDKYEDYLKTRIRKIPAYTADGKLWQTKWENYLDEWESQRLLFVNDLEYQNLIAANINLLYIQSIHCARLMKDYERIMTALNFELKNRKIKS